MKDIIELSIAVVYSSAMFLGGGYGLKTIHDEVKKVALTKVSTGLSSSEFIANALTGEKTGF